MLYHRIKIAFKSILKRLNSAYLIAVYLILFAFGWSHAQPLSKDELVKIIDSVNQSELENVDRVYNELKQHALDIEEDSIYAELTFKQIEKNGGIFLYSQTEILLGNLLFNEHYFLKNHPKILLRCLHDLARSYLFHSGSSEIIKSISEHYYKRYFKLLRQLNLNADEEKIAKKNKLQYLVHTKNDSLFYYLDLYKISEAKKAKYLNHWYKELNLPLKELQYATLTGDKMAIITAHFNNRNFNEVVKLYPDFLKRFKAENDILGEHQLYRIMGQSYLIQNKFQKAEAFYAKALNYFKQNTSSPYVEEIYNDLIDLQSRVNNLEKYRFYSNELISYTNNLKEQQLEVLRNHLDYSSKISNLELKLKNEEEALKIEGFQNQINKQKTIISFALGLIVVTLIFIYFYAVSSKTQAELEDANKQMVIDVLRSKFKPHFTFNVLSVINYFVEKKEVKNATLALTKMSSLLRSTLDNMNEKLVSFESEYQICQNYMYLESLRFSNKFDYEFQPLDNLTASHWLIPPGVLEPILENAVNHAFKGVDYKGKINFNYEITDDFFLKITIKDNGTGFRPSSGIVKKKSHGLKITRDYIKTVSKLYKKPIQLEFFSNQGTQVVLTIPRLNPDLGYFKND